MAMIVLLKRFDQKYYLSTLVVLLAPSLQAFAISLLSIVVLYRLTLELKRTEVWQRDLLLAAVTIVLMIIPSEFLKTEWLENIDNYNIIQRSFVFILSGCVILCFMKFKKLTLNKCIVSIVIIYLIIGYQKGQLDWFSNRFSAETKWVEVCEYIEQNTSIADTFIIPPEIYNFQYLSQRSAFFTFKHLPPELNRVHEWFNRSKLLRLIPANLNPEIISAPVKINYHSYNNLTKEDFIKIRNKYNYVNYCIVRSNINLSFPLVFANSSYKIYSLNTET